MDTRLRMLEQWEIWLTWVRLELRDYCSGEAQEKVTEAEWAGLAERAVSLRDEMVDIVRLHNYYEFASCEVDSGMTAILLIEEFLEQRGEKAERVEAAEEQFLEAIRLNRENEGPGPGGIAMALTGT